MLAVPDKHIENLSDRFKLIVGLQEPFLTGNHVVGSETDEDVLESVLIKRQVVKRNPPGFVGRPHVIDVDVVLVITSSCYEDGQKAQQLIGCELFPLSSKSPIAVKVGARDYFADYVRRQKGQKHLSWRLHDPTMRCRSTAAGVELLDGRDFIVRRLGEPSPSILTDKCRGAKKQFSE